MKTFKKIKLGFHTNWTTVYVGWRGLGVLSPWPDQWIKWPPLIDTDEISEYAEERLSSSQNAKENELIINLLSLDLYIEPRVVILDILEQLSNLDRGNPAFELRKWRLVLLEEFLKSLPEGPVDALTDMTEFWLNFKSITEDCPHVVQGIGNSITTDEYYTDEYLQQEIRRHQAWIEKERKEIKN